MFFQCSKKNCLYLYTKVSANIPNYIVSGKNPLSPPPYRIFYKTADFMHYASFYAKFASLCNFCFVFFRLLILRTELRQGKRLRKNRS